MAHQNKLDHDSPHQTLRNNGSPYQNLSAHDSLYHKKSDQDSRRSKINATTMRRIKTSATTTRSLNKQNKQYTPNATAKGYLFTSNKRVRAYRRAAKASFLDFAAKASMTERRNTRRARAMVTQKRLSCRKGFHAVETTLLNRSLFQCPLSGTSFDRFLDERTIQFWIAAHKLLEQLFLKKQLCF